MTPAAVQRRLVYLRSEQLRVLGSMTGKAQPPMIIPDVLPADHEGGEDGDANSD